MILTEEQKELYGKLRTKLQRAFVDEYCSQENPNQTAVYKAACKAVGQKPARNPTVAANTMLTNANVAAFISTVKIKAAEATQINAEWLLKRLKQIDDLDVLDILAPDMESFKPLNEWPKEWRISISGIDVQSIISGGEEPIEKTVKKIKWPDKVKNLELIGKHVDVKAFQDRVEVTVDDDLVHLIQAGRARAIKQDSE